MRIFGRLASGMQPSQATAEIAALTARAAAAAPDTHQHLRPRVFSYGATDLGSGSWIAFAITHGPVLLVLIVACANVGTLVYARTATRQAEIAVRHALGASRARIVGQLFVEALVLAAVAAGVGLFVADLVLRWVFTYMAQAGDLPFWIRPGLKLATVIYAALLAIVAAGILGALPAIKATGSVAPHLSTSGVGGATLRFGKVWTTVMIAQVALTVICIVPATESSEEAIRDRLIRSRFPAEQYLAVEITIDRDGDAPAHGEATSASASSSSAVRAEQIYRELERRISQEPGVVAVTFGDRLPGMGVSARRAHVEVSPGADPVLVPNLWFANVGPGYFDTFDRPILSGRGFHSGDLAPGARAVVVNEAFARRCFQGASPVGRRVRYEESDPSAAGSSFDIVGMVRDIGMTPTDLGEAPYVFHPASAATASPLVMGIRLRSDPSAFALRVRDIAAAVDPGVRLDTVQPLDDLVWNYDASQFALSAGIGGVVSLGLFLSAAGIFSRALLLIGSGIVAGNAVIALLATALEDATLGWLGRELLITSAVMLIVGLLGCVEPARRALRINPMEALKDA